MYWADKLADKIIKSGDYLPYWVDDMKTPSGRVHVGSVRAVVTHELIYRALLSRGKNVTFSYVFDDQDPMDKVPHYLDKERYSQHLGKPLYKIPSPDVGYKSYGDRWGQEYIEIFNSLGVHPKIIRGSELYLSGKMNEMIRICLDNAGKISNIYKTLYGHKKPSDWYPFNITCENCGKLSTTVTTDWDGEEVVYECGVNAVDWTKGCGNNGKASPFDGSGKLPWKVEWACKWKVIGVTVEGAGKDHMSDGGSHDFAKLMCKNVIDYQVPFAFSHEFFLIGGKKMSSSKGLGASAKEISEIIPPYLIRCAIARVKYNVAIDFEPGGMAIPDLYDYYDTAADAYWKKGDRKLARIYELSQLDGSPPKLHFVSRFRDVATYIQHPELDIYEKFREIKGKALTKLEREELDERIKYAKIWIDGYAPEDSVFVPNDRIPEKAANLSRDQKKYLLETIKLLKREWRDVSDLQLALYNLSKEMNIPAKAAFGAIYMALIGKDHGPRAAWFLLEHKEIAIKRFKEIQDN